jgi:hypothetical protein
MGASKEGMLVHPTPFEEQSVLDSARDLLVQVSETRFGAIKIKILGCESI